MRQSWTIAMAFVGLLVGAGFATGREMMQYFVSFGTTGFWAILIAGVIIVITGAVIMQIGSYFLADEHGHVFKNVAHPKVSWLLDASVSVTMAVMGIVMLAGAGSTLEQSFGLPSAIGSALLAIIVYFMCFLDTERVSNIIAAVTPLMVIAVIVVFFWTIFNIPDNFSWDAASHTAETAPSPVSPWWWSAINQAGMTLSCAIGMSLVIGGAHTKLRSVAIGGVLGGIILTLLMFLETVILFVYIDEAIDADVPMAAVVEHIHPVAGAILSILILLMIFNTALGDVYAFSKRVDVAVPTPPALNVAIILVISWLIAQVGFTSLVEFIFPILGYMGMAIGIIFVVWRIRWSNLFDGEKERRETIRELTRLHIHPDTYVDNSLEIEHQLNQSEADNEKLLATVAEEERSNLDEVNPEEYDERT